MSFLILDKKFGTRILALLFLMFISFLVSVLLMMLLLKLNHMPLVALADVQTAINGGYIRLLKWFQIIQSVFLFIIPAWGFAYLVQKRPLRFFSLNKFPSLQTMFLVVVMMLVMFPVNNFLAEWNRSLEFPQSLSGLYDWMLQKETELTYLTEQFLKINGRADVWINILMIAIIPAIGEELLFRGVLQRLFIELTKNNHWGIWITAFLFSAVHMEFLTFIPRFLLGALFGYLYVWSRSLWLPIVAHLVNNGLAVIISIMIQLKWISAGIDTMGQQQNGPTAIPYMAAILVIGMIFFIYRQEKLNYRE